jgi:hypothetical protein
MFKNAVILGGLFNFQPSTPPSMVKTTRNFGLAQTLFKKNSHIYPVAQVTKIDSDAAVPLGAHIFWFIQEKKNFRDSQATATKSNPLVRFPVVSFSFSYYY